MASQAPDRAPARSSSDRTREIVGSVLERRVRVTLLQMFQVVALLMLVSTLFGVVLMAMGRFTGGEATFAMLGVVGVWCWAATRVIRAGGAGAWYKRLLWPIFLSPTLILMVAAMTRSDGAASVFNGPVTLAYFLCIIVSASLFDRQFTWKVTGVSVTAYLGVYWFLARVGLHRIAGVVAPHDPVFAERIGNETSYVMRAFALVAAGAMVAGLISVAYEIVLEVASVIAEFGTVIDPRVRDLMLAGAVGDEGDERDATVLFADIRGFTTFAEKWEPPRLLRLMKEYFDLMGDPIRSEDGTIIEYIGDEILALFGAPELQPDHAARAGRAALAMQRLLAEQRPRWEAMGYPRIEIGIGLNAGRMLVGRIGSTERQKYGALGDNVNLGSRVQGLTREYGVPIVVTDAWAERAGSGFVLRELDHVQVKGRNNAVTIYALVGATDDSAEAEATALMQSWQVALDALRAEDSAGAREAANACLRLQPDDGPALRLLRKLAPAE